MPLSQAQLRDVCMIYGQSDRCRYLAEDNRDYSKWYCMKQKKNEKNKIDLKIQDFLRDCKIKGVDPSSAGVALGDNCQGYPVMKHIEQGYDKP